MFNFKKAKKTKTEKPTENNSNSGLEEYIVDNIRHNTDVEKAIITYILLCSKESKIKLVRSKDEDIYVKFVNSTIRDFLKQWYSLLSLNLKGEISPDMYRVFVDAQLKKSGINQDEESSDIVEL